MVRKRRLPFFAVELESRVTPAWSAELVGGLVSFLGDADWDAIAFNVENGLLKHDVVSGQFDDLFDMDSDTPGSQSITATAVTNLSVIGGNGQDAATFVGVAVPATIEVERLEWQAAEFAGADATLTGSALTLSDLPSPVLMGLSGATFVNLVGGSGANAFDASGASIPVRLEGLAGNDTLRGGSAADALAGGDGDDLIAGNGGDDDAEGSAGLDTYLMGSGDDVVSNESGANIFDGGPGIDSLDRLVDVSAMTATNAGLTINGQMGPNGFEVFDVSGTLLNDDIDFSALTLGVEVRISGEAGHDTLRGGAGTDTLQGGDGDDLLEGLGGGDDLSGGPDGAAGTDTLRGGGDNDSLFSEGGPDVIDGGDGVDMLLAVAVNVLLVSDSGLSLNGGSTTAHACESLVAYGTSTGDVLDASGWSGGNVHLQGGAGDDTLRGGAGQDTLYGDAGSDLLEGRDGGDSLLGGYDSPLDTLIGGAGDDFLYGDGGTDCVDGGAGFDTFTSFDIATALVTDAAIELNGAAGPNNLEVLSLTGTPGADLLDASAFTLGRATLYDGPFSDVAADTLRGGSGSDYLRATGGNDRLEGGDGADDLEAGDGADTVSGGSGDDLLSAFSGLDVLAGDAGQDSLHLQSVYTSVVVTDGSLTLNGGTAGSNGFELISYIGTTGSDVFDASTWTLGRCIVQTFQGHDTLLGGRQNDELHGGPGLDYLNGGDGNNLLTGGDGNDTLISGYGSGTLQGDAGFDSLFLASNNDPNALVLAGGTVTFDGLMNAMDQIESLTIDTLGGVDNGVQTAPVTPSFYFVNGLEPTVDAGSDAVVGGAAFARTGSFVDIGTGQSWTAQANFGDGTGWKTVPVNQAARTFSLNHTFAMAGDFTVCVRVTDQQGNDGVDTFVVHRPVAAQAGVAGTDSRSRVNEAVVSFNRAMTLGTGYYLFEALTPGTQSIVTPQVDFVNGGTRIRFAFSGNVDAGSSLKDGLYRLTLNSQEVLDPLGQALDGDGDGQPGGNLVFNFHRLFGDADGNRTVDGADFATFGGTFGTTLVGAPFDFDGNNSTDGSDFSQFGNRFGLTL